MEGLEAGSIFAVDYRVLRTVYTGGLSIIYEVEQQSTGARRALKVVFGDLGQDSKIRDAFLAEAKRATRIQSDHVAEVWPVAWTTRRSSRGSRWSSWRARACRPAWTATGR